MTSGESCPDRISIGKKWGKDNSTKGEHDNLLAFSFSTLRLFASVRVVATLWFDPNRQELVP